MMTHYYEVLVATQRYRGENALTYHSNRTYPLNSIVLVPVQNRIVAGIVIYRVTKPNFPTKSIVGISIAQPLPKQLAQLVVWLAEFYTAPVGVVLQQFLPNLLSNKLDYSSVINGNLSPNVQLPSLTNEQKNVLLAIKKPQTYILHGETGSGKTRVYIELAKKSLALGRSVIVLTPEISLTSQLSNSFNATFGHVVRVVHSQLSPKQRQQEWLEALHTHIPLIIIGPRSALFSPLNNVGLIIVDEAHENAYKQGKSPFYHAIRVASKLANAHQATLVLGSATPPLIEYYVAEQKKLPILRMERLALQPALQRSNVTIVDIKNSDNYRRSRFLSETLINAVSDALDRHEQSLLFLNRRGTARVVICQVCGWQDLCPNCDVPLVYHGDEHLMRCHTCKYKQAARTNCPICGSNDIILKSIGTKAIVEEVQRIFPKARLQRFDSDNRKAERFEQHYHKVRQGDVDILIGTQTVAKGLDLPLLSVVGVIIADTNLYTPDFTASERMYQLITQVLGRVGRGHRNGTAVIQTYQPNHKVLQNAIDKNWSSFYQSELAERQQYLYPPFCYLLKLSCQRRSSLSALQTAQRFVDHIHLQHYKVYINGPTPAFHEKIDNRFIWQIIVKAKQRTELQRIVKELPSGWKFDIDPISLL